MKYAIRTVLAAAALAAALSYAAADEPVDPQTAAIEQQYEQMSDCEKTRGDAETQPEPCKESS